MLQKAPYRCLRYLHGGVHLLLPSGTASGQRRRTAPGTASSPLPRSVKAAPKGLGHTGLLSQGHPPFPSETFLFISSSSGLFAQFLLDGIQHFLFRQGSAQFDISTDDDDIVHLGRADLQSNGVRRYLRNPDIRPLPLPPAEGAVEQNDPPGRTEPRNFSREGWFMAMRVSTYFDTGAPISPSDMVTEQFAVPPSAPGRTWEETGRFVPPCIGRIEHLPDDHDAYPPETRHGDFLPPSSCVPIPEHARKYLHGVLRIQSRHSSAGIPQFVGQFEQLHEVNPFPAICISKAFRIPLLRLQNTVGRGSRGRTETCSSAPRAVEDLAHLRPGYPASAGSLPSGAVVAFCPTRVVETIWPPVMP